MAVLNTKVNISMSNENGEIGSRLSYNLKLSDFTDYSVHKIVSILLHPTKHTSFNYSSSPISNKHELISREQSKYNRDFFTFMYDNGWCVILSEGKIIISNGSSIVLNYQITKHDVGHRQENFGGPSSRSIIRIMGDKKSVLSRTFNLSDTKKFSIIKINDNINVSCLYRGSIFVHNITKKSMSLAIAASSCYSALEIKQFKDGRLHISYAGKSKIELSQEPNGVKIMVQSCLSPHETTLVHPEIPDASLEYLFRPEFQFLIEMKMTNETRAAFDEIMDNIEAILLAAADPYSPKIYDLIQVQKNL